jgi:hypothetical protein
VASLPEQLLRQLRQPFQARVVAPPADPSVLVEGFHGDRTPFGLNGAGRRERNDFLDEFFFGKHPVRRFCWPPGLASNQDVAHGRIE